MGLSALFEPEAIAVRAIIELLAPTLGWEKSAEVVTAAGVKLGLPTPAVSPAQANALLEELARSSGMVGVTARFARSRTDFTAGVGRTTVRRVAPPQPPSRSEDEPPASLPPASGARLLAVGELVGLLANTIGQERSQEAVSDAIKRFNLPTTYLDRKQTMRLLDELAREPGLVGITARFAKARAILRFGGGEQ